MTESIPILIAFGAGLLSFLSPCVLPLAPVYLATLMGPEIFEGNARKLRLPLLKHSLVFIGGFAMVFTLLGTIAGLTGYAINPSTSLLQNISGILLIVLGIFMLAAYKVPWLNFEKRLKPSLGKTTGFLRSFLIGAAFSLGWTACVGPILGGILTLASTQATAWQGALLLAIYSIGLGLPFIILGLAFDSLRPVLKRIGRYSWLFYLVGGSLLIGTGILVLTGQIDVFLTI